VPAVYLSATPWPNSNAAKTCYAFPATTSEPRCGNRQNFLRELRARGLRPGLHILLAALIVLNLASPSGLEADPTPASRRPPGDPHERPSRVACPGFATIYPMLKKVDCRGLTPESWACIDCGVNTELRRRWPDDHGAASRAAQRRRRLTRHG
jgi:hypothetical protein